MMPPSREEGSQASDPLSAGIAELHGLLDESVRLIANVNRVEAELRDTQHAIPNGPEAAALEQRRQQMQADLPAELRVLESRITAVTRLLYDVLLAPLAHRVKRYERLIIVPHGKLHHVPFHALLDEEGETLLDKCIDVSYMASLSGLKYCYESTTVTCQQVLLCMGDPTEDLPSAAAECDQIAPLYGELAGKRVWLGKTATKSVLREHGPEAEVIHLAMHGQYDAEEPMNSSLVFADGPLPLYEVDQLVLTRTETVVLSTCVSAMSEVTASDELVGLVRGFFRAGARSIVASLWPVHSEATAQLMKEFHARLQADPQHDKARSLREAMISVKEKHPFVVYWAPFCLYGRHSS
jgi:CHAT domain-containing protein